MSSYQYVTRSTTPPLYYRRPEGVAPSYQTLPTRESFQIPSSKPHTAVPPSPRGSYTIPTVSNPFLTATPNHGRLGEPQNPSAYLQERATPRWAPKPEEHTLWSSIDAQETSLASEETLLKAKLMELQSERKRQEEEQVCLSNGWATLFEREERYYTEPVPDLSSDVAAREQRCSDLHAQLEQMESHLFSLQQHLDIYAPLLEERSGIEKEIVSVRNAVESLQKKRQGLIARCERYFDVETKRAMEGKRAIHRLDVVLKEMMRSGPLAQLQPSEDRSRSTSRCVTFAPTKSIVLDVGSQSNSVEPDDMGLTNSLDQQTRQETSYHGDRSICIGLDDEELGGNSVVYSLNNTSGGLKKRRMEVQTAI